MAQFYGSTQASAKRVLYSSGEMRANSNGQRTSVKKKKAKHKAQPIIAALVSINFFPISNLIK